MPYCISDLFALCPTPDIECPQPPSKPNLLATYWWQPVSLPQKDYKKTSLSTCLSAYSFFLCAPFAYVGIKVLRGKRASPPPPASVMGPYGMGFPSPGFEDHGWKY
ncbi:hypothetical protein DPV78_001163 [Talaromyces pinophilus]|nr:hypothetical protein DPV78_001163 [Talaromyces pinophilus]